MECILTTKEGYELMEFRNAHDDVYWVWQKDDYESEHYGSISQCVNNYNIIKGEK